MKTSSLTCFSAAFVLLAACVLAQDSAAVEPTSPTSRLFDKLGPTPSSERGPAKAVLVVQNHVSDDFKKPLSGLGDRLAAAISGDLLTIIDPNDAVGDNLNCGPWGENLPFSSATRLAENLDASLLITAAINEASVEDFLSSRAKAAKMTLTVSAKRVPSGASFAAVTVTETSRKMSADAFSQNSASIYSDLVGRLVSKAAEQFLAKVSEANLNGAKAKTVTVFFGCNVLGADVEVDGLSLGSCPGQFSVTPGIHSVHVSYPPYYYEFRKQAKLTEDGQTFAVVLQITPEGEKQRQNGELFKKQLALADAMLERYKLSGETDDHVRKTIADGTGVYWQNSYGRIAITDGQAGNLVFATPTADAGDLAVPPNPGDVGKSLGAFLLQSAGR